MLVQCKGGHSGEKSLSLHIRKDGNCAAWICFRGKCGWQGSTMAFVNAKSSNGKLNPTIKALSSYGKLNQTVKAQKRELIEKNLELEPLSDKLLAYFAGRMISAQTLQRNHVMQKKYGVQIAIAFAYKRNGALVGCKYRALSKKFWQEPDTERIFYGVDDIKNASDIIIVEGEIDKLAMEEAGFRNCVSVPDGAPAKVSTKDVPAPDQDRTYRYLWNCKEYIEKVGTILHCFIVNEKWRAEYMCILILLQASRIILATDGDPPGHALAEELARRLGRERCWRVKWPKKNEIESFKDANEVRIM
ncbi:hypothetical protein Cgig2_021174 [Carnegiea gigantea]|uniref:Toprim domain-containing protein n=1 Tax=Carnegiea gigantea TaxID=171969 RepID=A0A9Q1QQD9_9CARY|nr:hypothetical protein Cgig2_021174 [Carnegiea gigantea]